MNSSMVVIISVIWQLIARHSRKRDYGVKWLTVGEGFRSADTVKQQPWSTPKARPKSVRNRAAQPGECDKGMSDCMVA